MDPRKLAKLYEREIRPHWDDRFVPFLLESYPQKLPAKARLLELGCASGRLTEEIVRRLPEGGRLVAVEDVRELMDQARLRVLDQDRKSVFFKKERPDELSFADGTFDAVFAGVVSPAYRLQDVVREASRLLKPDGVLLLGAPLQGSFQELLDVYREVLEKEDLVPTQEALDRFTERLPNRLAAGRLLSKADLVEGTVKVRVDSIHFDDGLQLVGSALAREHCLDNCLSLIRDRGWREGVLAGMIRALDTYFPEGVDVSVVIGRLEAVKP